MQSYRINSMVAGRKMRPLFYWNNMLKKGVREYVSAVIFKRRCIMAEPIFKAASPEEIGRRKVEWERNWNKDFETFQRRKDVIKQADNSYVVGGDVADWGSLNLDDNKLAVQYQVVGGNFSCSSGSLNGAPTIKSASPSPFTSPAAETL